MNGTLVRIIELAAIFMFVLSVGYAQTKFKHDVFKTSGGELKITFIGHGSLMMDYDGKVIHIDPTSMFADYSTLPKADLILITHEHPDHLDAKAIKAISREKTEIVANAKSAKNLHYRCA